MSDKSVSAVFGFRNQQAAAVFGGDVTELACVQPCLNNPGSDWIVPEKVAFVDGGERGGAAGLTFSGDVDSIEAVFLLVEKYGGWLKGGFEADPSVASNAIELALKRGWVPGRDEENRPGGLSYSPVVIDHGTETELDAGRPELADDSDEANSETGELYPYDEADDYWEEETFQEGAGRKKWIIGGIAAGVGLVIGAVAIFGPDRGDSLADELAKSDEARILDSPGTPPEGPDLKNESPMAEVSVGDSGENLKPDSKAGESPAAPIVAATKEQLQQVSAVADLYLEAMKLLPGEAGDGESIKNGSDLLALLDGAKPSMWNPEAFCLISDLGPGNVDPWGQEYEVRIESDNQEPIVRFWSVGPDMTDDGGEGDDVSAPPANFNMTMAMARETEAPEPSEPVLGSTTDPFADLKALGELPAGWSWEGDSLVSPVDGEHSRVDILSNAPEFFIARMVVERRSGSNGLAFGFSVGDQRTNARFDGKGRRRDSTPIRLSGIGRRARVAGEVDFLLPVGESKELIVRVTPEKVETEIVGGTVFTWPGEVSDLSIFPPPFVDVEKEGELWFGSWKSSFAIHSIEIESDFDEAMKADGQGSDPDELPLSPPVKLPSLSVLPRSGIIPLGWKFLERSDSKSAAGIPTEWKGDEKVRKMAVLVELDKSDFASVENDLSSIKMPEGKSVSNPEQVETIRPGDYEIRLGGVERAASGLVYSASMEEGLEDIEAVSGAKSFHINIDGSKVNRYSIESDSFNIVHKTPLNKEGRAEIAVWAYFQEGEDHSPLFLRKKGGEWTRVPDRETIFPKAPIPPVKIPNFTMPSIDVPDIKVPNIPSPNMPRGIAGGQNAPGKAKASTEKVPNEMRDWTNVDGKKITARLIGRSETTAGLQTANGKVFNYPLSQLSVDDRLYIKKEFPDSN